MGAQVILDWDGTVTYSFEGDETKALVFNKAIVQALDDIPGYEKNIFIVSSGNLVDYHVALMKAMKDFGKIGRWSRFSSLKQKLLNDAWEHLKKNPCRAYNTQDDFDFLKEVIDSTMQKNAIRNKDDLGNFIKTSNAYYDLLFNSNPTTKIFAKVAKPFIDGNDLTDEANLFHQYRITHSKDQEQDDTYANNIITKICQELNSMKYSLGSYRETLRDSQGYDVSTSNVYFFEDYFNKLANPEVPIHVFGNEMYDLFLSLSLAKKYPHQQIYPHMVLNPSINKDLESYPTMLDFVVDSVTKTVGDRELRAFPHIEKTDTIIAAQEVVTLNPVLQGIITDGQRARIALREQRAREAREAYSNHTLEVYAPA